MKRLANQEGASIIALWVVLALIHSLLFLALMRSESAFRLTRQRYLGGVALDLAENGIELGTWLLEHENPEAAIPEHKMDVGTFSHHTGSFMVRGEPFEDGDIELISTGTLTDPTGKTAFTKRITVTLRQNRDGGWSVLKRAENKT